MAINKISEFPKVTPSADDKILVEKNGEGGHISLSEMPVSTPVEKKISDVQKDLNDRITALAFEPGDTTGDAELKDIRKPATGFTVPANANAGDAVRAQVTQLDGKINELKGDLGNISSKFNENVDYIQSYSEKVTSKYMDYLTGATQTVTTYEILKYTRDIFEGNTLILGGGIGDKAHICFKDIDNYNRDGYLSGVLSSGDDFEFTIPSGCNYIYISIPMTMESTLTLRIKGASDTLKNEYLDAKYIKEIAGSNIVTAGVGKDFTKLTDAIAYAMEHKGTTIFASGVFDFREELGETYFNNFVYSVNNSGTLIGNDTTIIFDKWSGIVFEYDGTNTEVKKGYSPLSTLYPSNEYTPSFTIIGGFIKAKNCRYCVHDDVGELFSVPYKNTYKGVEFVLDNSANNTSWSNRGDAIGGGLGKYGEVYIEDCIVNSITSDDRVYDGIAYHTNNAYHDSDCKIVIKDCYIGGKGTIACRSYGSRNAIMSYMYASNNCLGSAIKYEKSTEQSVDSIELIEWNNVVRY